MEVGDTNVPSFVKLDIGGTKVRTTMATLKAQGPNFITTLIENDVNGTMHTTKV